MKLNWTEGGGQTKLVWHECFTLLLLQAVSCSCSFCLFGHFLVLLRLNETFWSVKLSLLCIESVTVWFLHTFFSWASMFAEKYKKKGLKWFQISFVQNLLIALLSFLFIPTSTFSCFILFFFTCSTLWFLIFVITWYSDWFKSDIHSFLIPILFSWNNKW